MRLNLPPVRHLATGIVALALFGVGASIAVAPASLKASGGGTLSSGQREEVRALVRAYILEHPEIIPEAVELLQQRQVAEVIDANREAIETPFEGAWAGAEDGDVVLVEFFDYNCPYCRLARADVARLIEEDEGLKVVYRDFPVLGPDSREAALASLSAARQDKYGAFYDQMFDDERRVGRQKIVDAVREAGLAEGRTAADMKAPALEAEIESNIELGRALQLTGTPSYIVGDQILSGAVGYEALKAAIEKARAEG